MRTTEAHRSFLSMPPEPDPYADVDALAQAQWAQHLAATDANLDLVRRAIVGDYEVPEATLRALEHLAVSRAMLDTMARHGAAVRGIGPFE
jgi:hypothetical protein